MRQCTKCKNNKPETEFYKRRRGTLKSWCKSCCRIERRIYQMKYRANNPKYRKKETERMRKWRADNLSTDRKRNRIRQQNRRARKRKNGGIVTIEEWKALCNHYGNVCLACGKPEVTIDHVIPVSRGGMNDISNIQPLCKSCNTTKSNRIVDYRPRPAPWRQLRLF